VDLTSQVPSRGASARAGCAICKMSNGGDPLAVILQRGRLPLAIPAAGSPPSPRGGGGGRTTHRHPSAVVPAPKAAAGSRERAGGGGLSPAGPAAASHFHRGRGKGWLHISPEAVARPGRGRCPLSEPPGAAAPTQARRGGALERRNPLKYFLHNGSG
jgi:hypothetical protein